LFDLDVWIHKNHASDTPAFPIPATFGSSSSSRNKHHPKPISNAIFLTQSTIPKNKLSQSRADQNTYTNTPTQWLNNLMIHTWVVELLLLVERPLLSKATKEPRRCKQ